MYVWWRGSFPGESYGLVGAPAWGRGGEVGCLRKILWTPAHVTLSSLLAGDEKRWLSPVTCGMCSSALVPQWDSERETLLEIRKIPCTNKATFTVTWNCFNINTNLKKSKTEQVIKMSKCGQCERGNVWFTHSLWLRRFLIAVSFHLLLY